MWLLVLGIGINSWSGGFSWSRLPVRDLELMPRDALEILVGHRAHALEHGWDGRHFRGAFKVIGAPMESTQTEKPTKKSTTASMNLPAISFH